MDHLKSLEDGEVGDWNVWFRDPDEEHLIKGRLGALRKSDEAAEKAIMKIFRNDKKRLRRIKR